MSNDTTDKKNNENDELVVCSVMVAPARRLVFYKFRSWVDQLVRVAVHTFAVDSGKIPLDLEQPEGYWYCAGSFCDIDEAGVSQHICTADLDYAQCLVAPSIKDDDSERPEKVISGEYGVHYVCHNITNRILYATEKRETLVNLDIPITGYELVVKSALGIYGQNKFEWQKRRESCGGVAADGSVGAFGKMGPSENLEVRSRDEEIDLIHLRACRWDKAKAIKVSEALLETDEIFRQDTNQLIEEFDSGDFSIDEFNAKMISAANRLLGATIKTVGMEMAKNIFPDCELEGAVESKLNAERTLSA